MPVEQEGLTGHSVHVELDLSGLMNLEAFGDDHEHDDENSRSEPEAEKGHSNSPNSNSDGEKEKDKKDKKRFAKQIIASLKDLCITVHVAPGMMILPFAVAHNKTVAGSSA